MPQHRASFAKYKPGNRRAGLALRVLRCLAGALQTGLLALFHAGIACEQARLLESGAEGRVGLYEGAGHAMAHGTCLACGPTTEHLHSYVVLAEVFGELQGLLDHLAVNRAAAEVVLNALAVHYDLAVAG